LIQAAPSNPLNMPPQQNFDTTSLLDFGRQTAMHPSSEASYKAISSSTFDRPTTALVLVNGVLASFQTFPSEANDNCVVGQQVVLNGAVPASLCNRADNSWMEPLPFKEVEISVDEGEANNIESKRRTLQDTANLINLASYTANLDDPFAPRPIAETADEGMAFVDETTSTEQTPFVDETTSTEQIASSVSCFDTQDEDEDEAERYFEIADILNDDFTEQSSHSNKRPRSSLHNELDIFEEEEALMSSSATTLDAINSEALQEEVLSTSVEPTTTMSHACDESEATMDASSIIARLDALMFQSELTQSALQYFDKRRGLPKSHCQTMVNSSRSRKQLLERKIIKKWNGCPLLGGDEGGSISADELSVKSDPGPRRKRRRKQSSTRKPLATSIDRNLLFEKLLSKNADATRHHQKPQRRMSA